MVLEAYLSTLPEVVTERMPRGTIFYANGLLYQIVETAAAGFSKARQWRRDESTDVALVSGSLLAKTLPVVSKGRILPVYRSRNELSDHGAVSGFLFPTEVLAKDAAYLDVALIIHNGAYVRNHGQAPGFAVTDGAQIFRLYYFLRFAHGRETFFTSRVVENPHCELRSYTEGPAYWRLLPSWKDAPTPPASRVTQVAHTVGDNQSIVKREVDPMAVTQVSSAITKDQIMSAGANSADVTLFHRPRKKEQSLEETQANNAAKETPPPDEG